MKKQNIQFIHLFPSSRFCSCFLVVTILALAVCVAMAYVGAEGLDDCPGEPMIPKYLMGKSETCKDRATPHHCKIIQEMASFVQWRG